MDTLFYVFTNQWALTIFSFIMVSGFLCFVYLLLNSKHFGKIWQVLSDRLQKKQYNTDFFIESLTTLKRELDEEKRKNDELEAIIKRMNKQIQTLQLELTQTQLKLKNYAKSPD